MSTNYQIFNVKSLNDLFLDCRFMVKQREILIFELNSTSYPTQMKPKLKKALTNHHLTIKILNLKKAKNVQFYRKLSTRRLVGYGITNYDTLIVSFLISRLANHQSVTTARLRKFSAHLYYLDCTDQSPVKALKKHPDALSIRQHWLRDGNFIDFKDYVKKEPLNLAAAKNGLAIHYHRPLNHLTSRQQFHRYLTYSISELLTIYDLAKLPSYQRAIKIREWLINAIKTDYPQLKISLSTPLVSLAKAAIQTSKRLPEVINYKVPNVTRNLLDGTLRWVRKIDERHQLHHHLIRHFLPIYNYYKNLQGQPINQRQFTNPNLNLPFVKPNGNLATNWLKLGKRFTSTNVNLAKLTTNLQPKLFVQSKRSGNWLINRKYRTRALPGKYQINLTRFRIELLNQLGIIKPNLPALLHRLINLIIDLGTSQKLSLAIQNQFASAQIMWQLMLWQVGEQLTLNRNEISQTTINGFKLAKKSTSDPIIALQVSFHSLLKKPFSNRIMQIIPHPTHKQLLHQIQHARDQLLDPKHFVTALRIFQIIPSVRHWSHQVLFIQNHQGQTIHNLGTVARIFLVKPNSLPVTIHVAKVTRANWYQYNNVVSYHNHLIDQVERTGVNGHVRKLRHLSSKQNVLVSSKALKNFTPKERHYLYRQLDLNDYVK